VSPEKLRKLAYSELDISTVKIIPVRKWGNEQTDRHARNLGLFELVYKNHRYFCKQFEKDSSSRTGLHNFSKELRQ